MRVKLTRGLFSLIDKEDHRIIKNYNWNAQWTPRKKYYAGSRGGILMHRLILGLNKGDPRVVDHINGDTLDNRRQNLRICSSKQNLRNTGPGARNKSGFKGVSWRKDRAYWVAHICIDNERRYIGRYFTREKAAAAYNKAAKHAYGEFAWLNKV